MRELKISIRLYLIALWCVTGISLLWLLLLHPPIDQLLLMLVVLGVYVLADHNEVSIESDQGQQVVLSVNDAVIIFLITVAGTMGAIVVALAVLISELLQRREWFKALFNVSAVVIAYIAAAFVYQMLQPAGERPFEGLLGLVTLASVAVTFSSLNILLVSLIMALTTQQSVFQIYREGFQPVNWVRLITIPSGAIISIFWYDDPWLLLIVILPLLMAQRAFVAIANSQAESRRNKELAAERAELLDELKVKQEELVQAAKFASLGTFASGIAHEFNNLLAAILGHAQLGLSTDDVAEKDMSLSVALRACQRGRSITGSLLTFARRREAQFGYHQVLDAVEDTLTMVEHDLRKSNIEVRREIEPVPPTMCDLGQLVQVVMNLVTNARDAMPQGGTLTIALHQEDEQIVLAVSDTGVGIPEDVRDKVFQPFVTTKGPGKGTGLGLAMCYGIIEGHGGSITIDSSVGVGTTMTVRLPISGSDQQVVAEAPRVVVTSLRILVVDDEADVLSALVRLLEHSGHKVQTACDAESALRVYRPRAFDVVLSDAVMPGISGARFIQRLRSIDAHVPILVITGQPGLPQVNAMLEAGANEVLGKPFVLEEVTEALSHVMRMRAINAN